ncbi:(2Fe-2S)-binding protein [Kitasatospora purpeofusca]|uniref:(2Fe-2S)-binding protein n=1 Tax=Kitasatospora purpeofusca TaxID=67352 RepID=UPI0022571851|nr:(2Fe-2S)-binding protein [Kitasatospora purpeofusca]MCX4755152.1 (2Fe-2S)-binding protein [Kitasatospora purpeofusca]WSR36958.1 (2Fe-2S)-binding protein [Kitasatospora purpeofusca]WSR37687.1 (2Fe-2S)-binding protein [Kitasatospora purpeofusca]
MSEPHHDIRLTVNGGPVSVRVPDRLLLCDLLRHRLGLTGTHVGCELGQCGACTVLLDGSPVRSCLVLAVATDGHRVITVEGLAQPQGQPTRLQEAFRTEYALQCGFCTPGMLITLTDLLNRCPKPERAQVRRALTGHLCRCTGYQPIVEAALRAAQEPDDLHDPYGGSANDDRSADSAS